MSRQTQNLDRIIATSNIEGRQPDPLPLSHLSSARWFQDIVGSGGLKPTRCKVFKKDLLYLYYGGVFYRGKVAPTQEASKLPIAFLFHPDFLAKVLRYFPFDTGALSSGRFGSHWTKELTPFKNRFRVRGRSRTDTPARLVHFFFDTNQSYLAGNTRANIGDQPEPAGLLHRFLTADVTAHGADHRQRCIECQVSSPIHFGQTLLWVAFPDLLEDFFWDLCADLSHIPDYFSYKSHRIFTPRDISAILEHEAATIIQKFADAP